MEAKGNVNRKDCKIAFFSELARDKDVLDLGVVQHHVAKANDPNWLHRAIVEVSSSCVGLDNDRRGVESLREKGYEVVCADAQNFNLGQKFDVVIAGDIVEHLSNVGSFLDCVHSHIKPNGLLALSTPNPFWWKSFVHVIFNGRAVIHKQHTEWLCPQTAEQVLERHGFRVAAVKFGSIYNFSTIVQRITWLFDHSLPLPKRIRLNTILLTAVPFEVSNEIRSE